MTTREGRHFSASNGRASHDDIEARLANGLGWFSIGLGLAEVLAPGGLARMIGVRDSNKTRTVLRTYGLREIASGVGILSQPRPAGWVWSRVAGDILDISSLAKADAWSRTRLSVATAAVLGVTALDVYTGKQLSEQNGSAGWRSGTMVRATEAIIINSSPSEVYAFWRNLSNLPRFMSHIESVQMSGERRSHWRAKGPGGMPLEWDAEIIEDQPDRRIVWRTLEGSDVYHSGSVNFERAPGGRGTLLRVEMDYAPPGGVISAKMAKLFGADPAQHMKRDLRQFKQIIETGEVVQSEASIFPGMHAARPPADEELNRVRQAQGDRAGTLQPSLV